MNTCKTNFQRRETIAFPVRYDGYQQVVKDTNGKLICDLKSWGNVELLNKPQELLEAIGEKIVKLMNESDTNKRDVMESTDCTGWNEEVLQFEWD